MARGKRKQAPPEDDPQQGASEDDSTTSGDSSSEDEAEQSPAQKEHTVEALQAVIADLRKQNEGLMEQMAALNETIKVLNQKIAINENGKRPRIQDTTSDESSSDEETNLVQEIEMDSPAELPPVHGDPRRAYAVGASREDSATGAPVRDSAPAAPKRDPAPGAPRKDPAPEAANKAPAVGEKEGKIPPVHLAKTDRWTAVSREMDRRKIRFTKARTTKNGIAIQPATASDHRALTKFFTDTREEYFTYSLQEEKPLRAVIRGIPDGIGIEEIKEDLSRQGIATISATRMTSRRTRTAMPLVLVQVTKNNEKIFQVTRCCQLVVRVEEQRASAEPTQCHRCQRFGHAQSRCTVAPRCVKCAGSHHSGDCPKPRTEKANCCNCGGDHPASYRGCPKHPSKTVKTKRAPQAAPAPSEATPAPRQAPKPAPRRAPQAAPTAPSGSRSYASAARSAPQQQTQDMDTNNLKEVVQKLHKLPGLIDFLLQAQEMLRGIFNQ